MTYALAWPLQEAIFGLLFSTPAVADLLGDRLYDAPPQAGGPGTAETLYLTLGDEVAEDWSTGTDRGAAHQVTLTVHAPRASFGEAKRAAGAICDALLAESLSLSRGRVVSVGFVEARTRRTENDALRQIALKFRIVAEDTA